MTASQPPTTTDRLHSNLIALAKIQPELAERLHWPVEGDHLFQDRQDQWVLRYRGAHINPVLDSEQIGQALNGSEGSNDSPLIQFGVGLGELLEALLATTSRDRVIAWERDPWMLRQALTLRDWTSDLRSGRFRFCHKRELAPLTDSDWKGSIGAHPLLARTYPLEFESLKSTRASKRAMICCGTLFVDSLADSLGKQGYSVLNLDVQRISDEETQLALAAWKPSLVASINCIDGLAEICEALDIAYMCWEIDPALHGPRPIKTPSKRSHIFTYRQASEATFRSAGFENVTYLPLAADPKRRSPQELDRAQCDRFGAPVSFVGTSLMANVVPFRKGFLAAMQAWNGTSKEACLQTLQASLESQRRDFAQYSIPEQLEQTCPGFRSHSLGRGLPDPALLIAEISAAEKRLTYVAALAPHGVVAWGDAGWAQLEARGVRHMGAALHETELPLIYSGSTINVDVGRLYQDDIVTMRIFDILACGGFVLAEHSTALANLFDIGTEIESYRDLAELRSKVEYFLEHPDQARVIAENGRQAVLSRHTIDSRVETMLGSMGSRQSTWAA
ncbi:MAG: glycosyltransferase [Planctomycetota bacterium]|nr:glycosyltransferase [Planctomycetota bacterium]